MDNGEPSWMYGNRSFRPGGGRRHLLPEIHPQHHLDKTLFSAYRFSPDYGLFNNQFGYQQQQQQQQDLDVHNLMYLFNNGLNINSSPAVFRSQFDGGLDGVRNPGRVFPQPSPNGFFSRNQNLGDGSGINARKPLLGRRFEESNFPSVNELRNCIVPVSKDHYLGKLLQNRMSTMSREEIDLIFSETVDFVGDLMLDPCGNFVVQKLLEVCTEEQRTKIIVVLTSVDFYLVRICLSTHGTRSVQKLLETLNTPKQISMLIRAISPGAVALAKDMNGHHVIQHCLKKFSHEDNKFLLNELVDKYLMIAMDKSGCCVLQHCMEFAQGELKQRLLTEIMLNAHLLSENPYGNYVVQHLFEIGMPEIETALLNHLQGTFVALACNKYGSNVVEKCLESGEHNCVKIIMELVNDPSFSMLLLDPFGNYVVQSALSVSKTETLFYCMFLNSLTNQFCGQFRMQGSFVHNTLVNMVQKHAPIMRSNIYGKSHHLPATINLEKIRDLIQLCRNACVGLTSSGKRNNVKYGVIMSSNDWAIVSPVNKLNEAIGTGEVRKTYIRLRSGRVKTSSGLDLVFELIHVDDDRQWWLTEADGDI
ncbi:hypothetical protein ACFE04_004140 [Oxalis oulophora]